MVSPFADSLVDVVLCGHLAWFAEEHPPIPGTSLHAVDGLCEDPEVPKPAETTGDRLIFMTCGSGTSRGRLQHAAVAAGFGIGSVTFASFEPSATATGLAIALRGLLARVRASPSRLTVSAATEVPTRVSRRWFLRLEPLERVPVPHAAEEICISGSGCRVCAVACPKSAITIDSGPPTVYPAACRPCGICTWACPTGAMVDDTTTAEGIHAQMSSLLADATEGLGIVYRCRRAEGTSPTGPWHTVEVSCSAAVPSLWAVAPLLLGAGSVAIPVCDDCPNRDESAPVMDLARKLAEEAGWGHCFGEDSTGEPGRREAASPATDALFAPGGQIATALAIAGAARDPSLRIEHEAAPLGVIEIGEACTGCTMCADACPTDALSASHSSSDLILSFDATLCVARGDCLPVCPELESDAISLTRCIDVKALRGPPTEFRVAGEARCDECGDPIAPDSMVSRVASLLGEEHAATVELTGRLCDKCQDRALRRSPFGT